MSLQQDVRTLAMKLIDVMEQENHGLYMYGDGYVVMFYHGQSPPGSSYVKMARDHIMENIEALNLLFNWAVSSIMLKGE
jgi:hypothetical protein